MSRTFTTIDITTLLSCSVMLICVLMVLGINIFIKRFYKPFQGDVILISTIWGFLPDEHKAAQSKRIFWNWIKLIPAGMLISSFVTFILRKKYDEVFSINCGLVLMSIWIIAIFLSWKLHFASLVYPPLISSKIEDIRIKRDQKNDWPNRIRRDNSDERLPVTIVTGFLGSGKTTAIKNILNNSLGIKILVIENEIGNEGIDHSLLIQDTNPPDIILLKNGCMCCKIRGDLLKTFHMLFSDNSFAKLDWILIETTGLADPAPVIQTVLVDPRCKKFCRLDGVLAVVDTKHFRIHLSNSLAGSDREISPKTSSGAKTGTPGGFHGAVSEAVLQLGFADVIILNKTDLVTAEELGDLRQLIHARHPHAKILSCVRSVVPLEDIINIQAYSQFAVCVESRTGYGENARDGEVARSGHERGRGERDSSGESETIQTLTLSTTQQLNLGGFTRWIFRLASEQGENIFRIKGLLKMHQFEEPFFLQGVHMVLEGSRGNRWPASKQKEGTSSEEGEEEQRSVLVIIGRDLDEDALRVGFHNCEIRADKKLR